MKPHRLTACGALFAALAAGCAGPSVPSFSPGQLQQNARVASAPAPAFVGFWESWSDTNARDAFYRLGSVPKGVTTVDVAFSIANGNTIAVPQNTYPLAPGAHKIHARGGKVLLSFGGATSSFAITSPQAFVANLRRYAKTSGRIFDGFDFDDEVIPHNGQQQLVNVLLAVRKAFPKATLSFDAFIDGADPGARNGHQGEDIAILQKAGSAIDAVNVMAYDQYGWVPTTDPHCSYREGTPDDCRLDVLAQFAHVAMPGGGTFPKSKIFLGLMIGRADDGTVVSPGAAAGYAASVKRLGYGGMMIWDLDLDNPQAPMNGTGYPKGTYVRAISTALGTARGSR